MIADFDKRILFPYGKYADLSYYNKRPENQMIPDLGGFQEEWMNACKGDLKTSCDFDYAGAARCGALTQGGIIQTGHLGSIIRQMESDP